MITEVLEIKMHADSGINNINNCVWGVVLNYSDKY